jgi:DNA processing protein
MSRRPDRSETARVEAAASGCDASGSAELLDELAALVDRASLIPSEPAPGVIPVELPDEAWVLALANLDLMGPTRLRTILDDHAPAEAWALVVSGRLLATAGPRLGEVLGHDPRGLAERWQRDARRTDPTELFRRHHAAGLGIMIRSSASFPTAWRDDVEPPSIILSRGDPDVVVGHRVAVVGTRDCTRYGYDVARSLGAELAEAGVSIVSGLALGIDGAAHAGALEVDGAPPIAVVGSGLDVIYPRRNRALWEQVAERGVIFSEYPLGQSPVAWHFPARNRLIAALADLVIVVESAEHGGSMLTVDAAADRDVPCLAVPGPVTSKMSAGPNKLLHAGADVARDTTDVLVRLGLEAGPRREAAERRPPPTPDDRRVLEAFAWQPATIEQLALRTGLGLFDLPLALDRLREGGWVDNRGGWYERIAR